MFHPFHILPSSNQPSPQSLSSPRCPHPTITLCHLPPSPPPYLNPSPILPPPSPIIQQGAESSRLPVCRDRLGKTSHFGPKFGLCACCSPTVLSSSTSSSPFNRISLTNHSSQFFTLTFIFAVAGGRHAMLMHDVETFNQCKS